jgi:exonuclease SbcD
VPSGNGPEPRKAQVLCVPWPNPREVLEWATAAGLPGIPSDFRKVPLEELTEVVAEATSAMIANLSELMVLGVPKILAAHLAVEGTKLGSEQSMMLTRGVGTLSYQQLHPRLFDYVALGHHHLAQEVGLDPPGAYAGSMMRVDFGESDEPKGFYVVDIEQGQPAETAFVPVRSRRFVTVDVRPKQEDPMAEVIAAIDKAGVADAIVRVIVRLSRAKAELFREAEVRRALEAAHSVAYIKREIDQDGRSRSPDGTRWEDLGPIEALRLYLRQKGTPGARLEELVVAAQRLLG